MTCSSILTLKDDRTAGHYHRRAAESLVVLQTITADGGFSWSEPEVNAGVAGKARHSVVSTRFRIEEIDALLADAKRGEGRLP